MRNFAPSAILLLTVLTLGSVTFGQPELDTSFDSDGKTSIVFGASVGGSHFAVQANNKIVLTGPCFNINFGDAPFCTIRLNEDGSFDNTFGNAPPFLGTYTIFDSSRTGSAEALAVQSDGKIVVVGVGPGTSNQSLAVVRYTSSGFADNSFGITGNGIVLTDITLGSGDIGRDVVIQPDGKILVAGASGTTQFVARYLTNGTLDPSFGVGGVASTIISGMTTTGFSIALQGDGKILVSGGTSTSSLITRYNSNGTPDPTWDGDGIMTAGPPGGGTDQGFRGLALQTDGRVVVVGHTNVVYRFNSDGSPDSTFDQDGSREALNNPAGSPWDVVISPGGLITVVGRRLIAQGPGSVPYDYLTARYLPTGLPDVSYSNDGYLDIDIQSSDQAWAVAADSSGRIVIAGRSALGTVQNPFEQAVFSVARLNAPPNAAVSITGRITDTSGRPVYGARVTVQGGGGTRTAVSNPFGYYRISNLQVGHVYGLAVASKRFQFGGSTVFVGDNVTNFDFTAVGPDELISR